MLALTVEFGLTDPSARVGKVGAAVTELRYAGVGEMVRWRIFLMALALVQCRSTPNETTHATTSVAKDVSTGSDWSAQSALATCEAAIHATIGPPPELHRANSLMLTCTSLVRGPACRKSTADQLNTPSTATLRAAVSQCASEYCERFAQRNNVVACRSPLPDAPKELGAAWVELRKAMLFQDFSETDRGKAAALLLEASKYGLKVPPPSIGAEDLVPPKIEVQLNHDGSLAVQKDGTVLGHVSSAARLRDVLPHCAEHDSVSIAAEHAVEHAAVIVVMDELRNLGCGHISFSRPQ